MLVGVGGGERVKVGVAATVGDQGLATGDTIEPTDGVETVGASSLHPTTESKISIKRRLEYLLTTRLLREDKCTAN